MELVISCRSRARNTAAWSALWCCSSDLRFASQRREDERMDLGWFPLFFHIFTAKNGRESSKVYIQYMWKCTSSPLAQGRQNGGIVFVYFGTLKAKELGKFFEASTMNHRTNPTWIIVLIVNEASNSLRHKLIPLINRLIYIYMPVEQMAWTNINGSTTSLKLHWIIASLIWFSKAHFQRISVFHIFPRKKKKVDKNSLKKHHHHATPFVCMISLLIFTS